MRHNGAARRITGRQSRRGKYGKGDDNWPAVAGNLGKARKIWGRLQEILSREGATKRVSGNLFKAVVQQVLLFGLETWVVSLRMEWAMSAFIRGAARRITGRQSRRGKYGKWFYPSLEGAMKEAGLTNVQTSIKRRQNTVAEYIATRPLLDLCEGEKQREGAQITMRWWDQTGIDWRKAKGRRVEMESESKSGTDTEGEELRDIESRARVSSGEKWSGASEDEWEVRQAR